MYTKCIWELGVTTIGGNMGLSKTPELGKEARVPRSIRDVFKPVTELETITGLKIALWSRAKVGKTHLAMTAPLPIYGIDTEGSWDKNREQFEAGRQEHIHVSSVLHMADKDKGTVDLITSLDAAKDAMDVLSDYIICNDKVMVAIEQAKTATLQQVVDAVSSETYKPPVDLVLYVLEEAVHLGAVATNGTGYAYVKPFPRGTIVLDSGTDIWDWLGIWKDAQNFTEPGRLQWGHANKRYNEFIMMMLHSKWNVIGTFKAEAMVDSKGGDMGIDKPKWQKKTDYWFDVIIELKQTGNGRQAIFRGDRFGGNLGTINNPSWDTLTALFESKKKVKVA